MCARVRKRSEKTWEDAGVRHNRTRSEGDPLETCCSSTKFDRSRSDRLVISIGVPKILGMLDPRPLGMENG